MRSLNGNLLCSVDTETTGLIAGANEAIQVAVIPLNNDLEPDPNIQSFQVDIRPRRPDKIDPEALKINNIDLKKLMQTGLDSDLACRLFDKWFQSLNLGPHKKIMPLGQNYPFDKGMIEDLIGNLSYQEYFHYNYRDLKVLVTGINDAMDWQGKEIPFPQVKLANIAHRLNIPYLVKHQAGADAIMTAKCYKAVIQRFGTYVL